MIFSPSLAETTKNNLKLKDKVTGPIEREIVTISLTRIVSETDISSYKISCRAIFSFVIGANIEKGAHKISPSVLRRWMLLPPVSLLGSGVFFILA